MELKLPPLVVFLFFALLMYIVASVLPFGQFDFFGRTYLVYFLLGLGTCIGLVSGLHFFRSKTTIDPMNPGKVSKLVVGGLYAISRNPMYLAMLLLLLGLSLRLENVFNLLLAAGFVSYMNRFQIIPEERVLQRTFGKEYQQYCVKVRRWF